MLSQDHYDKMTLVTGYGFTSHSTQNGISEMFPKPISWLLMEKLNLTQQKHAFTNQKKHKNKH